MSIRLTDKEWTQTLKQLEIPSGPFTQDVLLTSRVNTLMDHNGFYNLRAHVARCSPPCVNWAWEFLFRKRWIVSMRIGMSGNDAFLTQLSGPTYLLAPLPEWQRVDTDLKANSFDLGLGLFLFNCTFLNSIPGYVQPPKHKDQQ